MSPGRLGVWSVAALAGMALGAVLVGFVWLPSAQADFGGQGLWASICRAAGVPAAWGGAPTPARTGLRSTSVVLSEAMARPGSESSVGRGATLALRCSMCHGALGVSGADAPNLAGQYPEVFVKQLLDYRHGDRSNSVMQALAVGLTDAEGADLAAYYAQLPRPARAAPLRDAPLLVGVGDPMRNIVACAACHGAGSNKLGAPWLDGMPRAYLMTQLQDFASGARRNDAHAQMRNVARALSPDEITALAAHYAGRSTPAR